MRLVVLAMFDPSLRTLSYYHGWPRAFQDDRRFHSTIVNVLDPGPLRTLAWSLARADAIVMLHSVFSQANMLTGRLYSLVRRSRKPKVLFIGNEYKMMAQKMAFCDEVGVDLLVSQLLGEAALDLYRRRLAASVVGIPNTGVDETFFVPGPPLAERRIDLGYRAYDVPWYLGHRDRSLVAEALTEAGLRHGLTVDVSMEHDDRFDERGWARFLAGTVAQGGCEAGTDYFELDDRTRLEVLAYTAENPEASFDDVFERFFASYDNPVSGRTLSGRVVEAAATKTVQVLLEGEYGGLFQPGVHYIELARDLSNLDDVATLVRDRAASAEIAENAYRVAVEELTYERLIGRFLDALAPLL